MMKPAAQDTAVPAGSFTTLEGEAYYRISSCHRMPPFFMSIPSDTDLWMFITSRGGLTAGRVDAEGSLFPYETVDKLHDGHHHTGPITLIRARREGEAETLWEPLSDRSAEDPRVERNLYKTLVGSRVVFEEIHQGLELAFRYRWSAADEFGLVRTATLTNLGSRAVSIRVLDGIRNVLPYGAPLALYQASSSLADAYKRTDLDPETGLAIFSLTARIIDRAEAAEELRANVVWRHGPGRPLVRLSADALDAFRRRDDSGAGAEDPASPGDTVLTGRRGNYLALAALELEPGAETKWHLVVDAGRDHAQIAALRARLIDGDDLDARIEAGLDRATANLVRNVASADGLQITGHAEGAAHHFANVLFNNLRGGVFADGYHFPAADLVDFLRTRNRPVADRHAELLATLPARASVAELLRMAQDTGDADFVRLAHEYLPLHFGRRHGDPSRPWNRFAIHVRNEDGSRALRYQGNWRDIFQNWEALALGYPGFLPSLIAKFVNASTVDGFNPYRVTRDGIDWEVVDPQDPWSYIGYWGDHQIIYLLKFLETLPRFSPGALDDLLGQEIFSYADVPYRLKPYAEMLENPHATIVFDTDRAARVADRVEAVGTDGKLLPGRDGAVHHVTLLEKLLVPALSKLSNLVPDGGIWMNTQRPEWNDANNALVGNGVSMVTLCYLRRYLDFLGRLLGDHRGTGIAVSTEVAEWFRNVRAILDRNRPLLDAPALSDRDRKRLLDALGAAFSDYRATVYEKGFSGRTEVPGAEIVALCGRAIEHLDHAIRANRREDGLYHAYNILQVSRDGTEAAVHHLYEMLEGQVAVLSSGAVDAGEAHELITALFASRMYRDDQKSFMLYPERELPGFLEKNRVAEEKARAVPLLRALQEADDRSVLQRDAGGAFRFHGDFANARDLAAALDRLAAHERWREPVARDRQAVLDLFEETFHHRAFTGRSGTMYGYEGLGCIYWHMVAKLLLAVQEIVFRAAREQRPAPLLEALTEDYFRIRAGLGFEKTILEYGAFPTDPYSHTPRHAGAQQPGMTGQVKEEILTRFGELGVQVEGGRVSFRPLLLAREEFLAEAGAFRFHDLSGEPRTLEVPAGALAFTYAQVPVVYEICRGEPWIRVTPGVGEPVETPGDELGPEDSRTLFSRSGGIDRIEVGIPEERLRPGRAS